MRLLFHSWEFGSGAGGIGQYLLQMTLALREMGHEVVIVSGDTESVQRFSSNYKDVAVYTYRYDQIRSDAVRDLVCDAAARHDVDFIEGTDHWGECASILESAGRPKVVIKYHSCQYLKKISEVSAFYRWQKIAIFLARLRMRGQIRAEKKCVEFADIALAPSRIIFEEYRKQQANLPENIAVIPNLIQNLPSINFSYDRKPTLLFVGRLEILKGIEYLPGLLQRVQQICPDVVLEIAGSDQYARGIGSLKGWLDRQFGPLVDSVRYLGRLDWTELSEAYQRCWLLICPSKWDNFPMSVLEAMAHGKPVVATPHGGMSEMLEGTGAPICGPGEPGFSEAVIALLQNRQQRDAIGAACREKVKNTYTPDNVVPQYLEYLSHC